jgi:uncharacterized membrane protein
MPCPKNSDGFIDEGELWSLAYGKLKLPLGSLDDLSPTELIWISNGHYEAEREYFELLSFTLFYSARMANSNRREFKNPFARETEKVKTITQEQREKEIAILDSIFN